jgi:hypothetical protein
MCIYVYTVDTYTFICIHINVFEQTYYSFETRVRTHLRRECAVTDGDITCASRTSLVLDFFLFFFGKIRNTCFYVRMHVNIYIHIYRYS